MADPVQIRAKEKRLAEALRANLKRRKEQARERDVDGARAPQAETQTPLTSQPGESPKASAINR